MQIDNFVDDWDGIEFTADGMPTMVDVRLNDTDAAGKIVDRLFRRDNVRFLNRDWMVWDIGDRTLTLLLLDN